jgi:hypothetical protein
MFNSFETKERTKRCHQTKKFIMCAREEFLKTQPGEVNARVLHKKTNLI